MKEEYKAGKLKELECLLRLISQDRPADLYSFLSQTIDELWALPDKRNEKENSPLPIPKEFIKLYRKGFNACIAEAERMRDLSIKGKR